MRTFWYFAALSSAAFLMLCSSARGQSATLPGCESAPEVRRILDEKLNGALLDKMKFADRVALERQVLEDLITKYPREYEPYRRLISGMRWSQPDELPALRERFKKLVKENPDDPLALLVAGVSLANYDTPGGILLLEGARVKALHFPWPSLELAQIYFSGKLADKSKAAENIAAFFAECPASADSRALWTLTKNASLEPKVAVALRAGLRKETDPNRLKDFQTLWGLEFRTRPPQEHNALRKQVALDLTRLESVNPKGDAEWQAFLIKGYKQAGASQESITAREGQLLREFPKSNEAYEIVSHRWRKAHPEPEDQGDSVAWSKYEETYKETLKGWIRNYPDIPYLQTIWFYVISGEEALVEQDGIAALDAFVNHAKDFDPPRFYGNSLEDAADFLVHHKWQPLRALELLNESQTLLAKERERNEQDDNRSPDDLKQQAEEVTWQTQNIVALKLAAAKQAGRPELVNTLKASVEGTPPKDRKYHSAYWWNRAALAALENHSQDALAYYQLALQTRLEPPKAWRGKLRDDLSDNAHSLWKELGGTEAAWTVWSQPQRGEGDLLAEGRWEKPTKDLPSFELVDLSGRTWRLKELGGKTVLINLWATWCGPCNAELPRLQKFYEKNKDRSDVQILTFNIDEDLGLVMPYLKEKGYTFPVLPAYSTVVSLLDGFAIPQNWVVDSKGTWRWSQIGYGGGSDADFEKDLIQKLESTKAASRP